MPSVVLTDTFARANSSTPGSPSGPPSGLGAYTDAQGVGAIVGNQLVLTDKARSDNGKFYSSPVYFPLASNPLQATVSVPFTITTTGSGFWVLARATPGGPSYILGIGSGGLTGVGTIPNVDNTLGGAVTWLTRTGGVTYTPGNYILNASVSQDATSGTDLSVQITDGSGNQLYVTSGGVITSTASGNTALLITKTGDLTGPQAAANWGLEPNGPAFAVTGNLVVTNLANNAPLAVPIPTWTANTTQITLSQPTNTTGTGTQTAVWARQFDQETPVTLGTGLLTQTDTPPDGRPYKYTQTVTDSIPTVVSGTTVALRAPGRNIFYVALGDSITYGAGAGLNNSWPSLMPGILNEADKTRVWADGRSGSPVGKSLIWNEGNSGWSTVTYLGNSFAGSGFPIAIDAYISNWKTTIGTNDPNADVYVSIMLGANDMAIPLTASQFAANLATIASHITANTNPAGQHWKVILNYQVYSTQAGRPTLFPSYAAAIDGLIDGVNILRGDTQLYDLLSAHWPTWYLTPTEPIHPGLLGWTAMAQRYAQVLNDRVINPASTTSGTIARGGLRTGESL